MNNERKNEHSPYSIRTTNVPVYDIPYSVYLVIKKYGFIIFFHKIAAYFRLILKKVRRLCSDFFFSVKNEGVIKTCVRLKNFVLYRKGFLDKEEYLSRNRPQNIYCLSGDGIECADVLLEVEKYVKDKNQETILLISHEATGTGAPILVLNIAKSLRNNFGKNVVTILLKGGPYEREFEKYGLLVNLNGCLGSSLIKNKEISEIFKKLRSCGVEKCILNSVVSGTLIPFLAKNDFDYIALVHEQAGSIERHGFGEGASNIINYSKKNVFSSDFVKNEFIEIYDAVPERMFVRPQGLYFKNRLSENRELARQFLRKKLKLPQDSKLVLAAGYADRRKGFDIFYKMARKAHEAGRDDIEFVWLGNRNEYMSTELDEMAEKYGFKHKVHLCDFDRDPAVYFAGSDAFILTSREDPFPNVVLMAMQCGLPVLAFERAGGAPEVLKNGAGIVVPFLKIGAMANKLMELLSDNESVEAMSLKAKRIIESEYNFEKYVEFLLGLFSNKTEITVSEKVKQDLKVSVIVPNYNYEKFLPERLLSIVKQTHKPHEIIFLDDKSSDGSVSLAKDILSKTDISYRMITNEENVGCFKQWQKGIKEATGDLIWIAEADDSCEPEFLESLVEKFHEDPAVGLAYAQSMKMDEHGNKEGICYPYPGSDRRNNNRWMKDHMNDGSSEVCEYLSEKNIIVNASAVLMRKDLLDKLGDRIGGGFKQAGDWFTYINILKGSKIAFSALPQNYHRYHANNIVSRSNKTSEVKAKELISEMLAMHQYIFENFPISQKQKNISFDYVSLLCQNYLGKDAMSVIEVRDKAFLYGKAD